MARAKTLPMFPLGRVLFPHEALPLHVFEQRYREMVESCLAGDGEFGVVLIERGSEVGGGDSRFDVGTVAKIVEAGLLPDGRYLLATVGTRRLRVKRWLPDDPYPRAEVELLADEPPVATDGDLVELERELRRVSALAAELGQPAVVGVTLSDDAVRASFEAAAAAPLGPLDAQRLLELDDASVRLADLRALLAEQAELLRHRLSGA
jgi:Lon protease-like protein